MISFSLTTQSRKKILAIAQPHLADGREHLLSVPSVRANREATIDVIEIDDSISWRESHAKVLDAAYRKAPHGPDMLAAVPPCIADRTLHLLVDFNIRIIEALAQLSFIPTRLHRASALGCSGKRSEHLALICDHIGTNDYLSPLGSQSYLEKDNFSTPTASASGCSPSRLHRMLNAAQTVSSATFCGRRDLPLGPRRGPQLCPGKTS